MSLKITINNEEVVCNNNIQIKEEMLSTSSTILKNCYPKTWELDKDYVSRYYFPKDYSKCKITEDTFHPEQVGITVKDSNINLNYNSSLNKEVKGLYGDTFQQTYTGKNLCGIPDQTVTKSGVTITIKDGEITLNGTSTGTTKYLVPIDTTTLNGNYTLNLIYISGLVSGTTNFNLRRISDDGLVSNTQTDIKNSNSYKQISISGATSIEYGIYMPSGTKFTNYKFKVQLVSGTSSDYDYEPYVGGVKSPNPSYPQAIENVTGLQTITRCGKNLFDKNSIVKINGTIQSGANNFEGGGLNYAVVIPCKSNTTYTVQKRNDGNTNRFALASSETIPLSTAGEITPLLNRIRGDNSSSLVLTTGATSKYLIIQYYRSAESVLTEQQLLDSIQAEIGSTATTYEPYTGTTYEINLGKNLLDISNCINGFINSSGEIGTGNNNLLSDYIKVESGESYTISLNTQFNNIGYALFDNNKTYISRQNNNNKTTLTITIPSNAEYLRIWFNYDGTTTLTPTNILQYEPMIEKGSQATSYSPYFTPIELNSIPETEYQDRIYKDNGKWYVEKQIGKVVLDGSEDYFSYSIDDNIIRFQPRNMNDIAIPLTPYYSNYFKYRGIHAEITEDGITQGTSTTNSRCFIFINKSVASTINDFKTWLSTHNTEVDYVLTTPTYTEITNEELINSLESVSNINLQNGINNIVITSADLPMIMELHYNFKEAYTEEDLLFCGCVKNTGNISLNPREPHYVNLQVLDFKVLLSEGETLNYVINGKTIVEAINQVVASISDYGFVVGNIQILKPDDIINAYSTLNKTAYDVFQYIADITQSRWTTRMIDENTIAIDFYDPTLMPTANPIESTQEYACQNKINNITFNYSTNDYRNKQIMTSDEVFGNITQTETIIADGYNKNFMCENKIGTITGITVNGVAKTFITKSEQELGASADFVYQPGDTTFNSSSTIGAGNSIVITYYPIVKGREIILNSGETTRIGTQIGRKGTLSRYENRNDTTSSAELQKIGQSYIKYKGQAEISLKVVSENNLFNVGQIVEYQAPLEELSTEYMVKSKQIDWYPNIDKSFYTFELTNNFNYENAVNYFDNQRAKSQGNIGEGETITRNIDLESIALIKLYDTEIEEVQIQNPTSLDFALDGVII